jgi:lysine 2,3-aminomutase
MNIGKKDNREAETINSVKKDIGAILWGESTDDKKRELFNLILTENDKIENCLKQAADEEDFLKSLKSWAIQLLEDSKAAKSYYEHETYDRQAYEKLGWKDYALLRVLDYVDHSGVKYEDLNLHGKTVENKPFSPLWKSYNRELETVSYDYLLDMYMLFKQLRGDLVREIPTQEKVVAWMNQHPSGLDNDIVERRIENRDRILKVIIKKIEEGVLTSSAYKFSSDMSEDEKLDLARVWWTDHKFHLIFAIRTPELLNEMLGFTLSEETIQLLEEAKNKGIPFFVNPYYLSLLNATEESEAYKTDAGIRDYVMYSRDLIDEFGQIVAWEKEDIVEPGKPNAAGWILPTFHNLHRRYPEVAIMIPDTVGRACGGLCVSCQRMYDFQSGNLNFNLDKLAPKESWKQKLDTLMDYYKSDKQLRDVLITGGDALMSSDKSLKQIFDAVYQMAVDKKEENKKRPEGKKYAEILRIRLGTRLPVYIPQRITDSLVEILAEFKQKASKVGVKQFVIQTHFESSMEITPEAAEGIRKLLSAGWMVTNQLVFTAAASRRGHTSKLRKALNDIGVITYYTFNVKGYKENKNNFATNARAVQEQMEEKVLGFVADDMYDDVQKLPESPENMVANIAKIREANNIPFISTDRNVLNLPGVGKSLSYRTIGIAEDGRRLLEFDHDPTRWHSPIIHDMGKVIIPESKTMAEYLKQLASYGDDVNEYETVYGYSIGETEARMKIYEYPEYEYELTDELSNIYLF